MQLHALNSIHMWQAINPRYYFHSDSTKSEVGDPATERPMISPLSLAHIRLPFSCFLLSRGWASDAWFLIATAAAAIYFIRWLAHAWNDESRADNTHVMRLCMLASSGLTVFGVAVLFPGNS
jgi:hypothetical protein